MSGEAQPSTSPNLPHKPNKYVNRCTFMFILKSKNFVTRAGNENCNHTILERGTQSILYINIIFSDFQVSGFHIKLVMYQIVLRRYWGFLHKPLYKCTNFEYSHTIIFFSCRSQPFPGLYYPFAKYWQRKITWEMFFFLLSVLN